jgi:hypothetical protein
MRKEIIFVIIASILFGAIIAFGVWRANTALRNDSSDLAITSTLDDSEDEHIQSELGLTIAKPSQDDVVTESPITISGITMPDSWVVLSTEDKDYIIQSDNKGLFESEIDLVGGINQITTTVFDENGNSINKTLRVIYSSEFADALKKSGNN